MNRLLELLLGVDELDLADEAVRFGFERPLPAWGWFLVVVGAVGLAAWSYRRLQGGRLIRIGLAGVRALLLVFLVLLVSGPKLSERTEAVERDWVLVLVDRSASLRVPDAEGERAGERLPREAQLRRAIQQTMPGWRELSRDRTVVWLGFDAGAFDLPVRTAAGGGGGEGPGLLEAVDLGDADGVRTALGRALDQALARAAARPLAAVVIVSDGRSTDDASRAARRRLQADRVPVHTVALGAAEPLGDLAVRRVEAPRFAYVNDGVPVRIQVERMGGRGRMTGVVQLVDRATGAVLDEQPVAFAAVGEAQADVLLSHRQGEPGERALSVRVVPDGPDLLRENNAQPVTVAFTDRPLRVLYIDGYARWEQRYLRNLLIREPSVTASSLLLAPDRRYTQEGDVVLAALPDSPEQWAEFDVVILGDVRPQVFTRDQLAQLRDHVALAGGGLIWIGGPAATPSAWWTTPLADLLPITRTAYDGSILGVPVTAAPTGAAERLAVLRLAGDRSPEGWPAVLSDPSRGWPLLRWVQWITREGLKPTTEVLAEGVEPSGARHPLVMTMRYGAGRVLYVATDEIWRWRYERGEVLFERFWLQLIRMLGRESLERAGREYLLSAAPERAVVDQVVRLSMELFDQALIEEGPPSIELELRRDGGGDEPPVRLALRPEDESGRAYVAVWLPAGPGRWTAETLDQSLFPGAETSFEVVSPDDELRFAEADHAFLASLSDDTGGLALDPGGLERVFENIPNRTRRQVAERDEPLWDTPLALGLLIVLVTSEWVGRRLIRLI